jgi:hypothetical protein
MKRIDLSLPAKLYEILEDYTFAKSKENDGRFIALQSVIDDILSAYYTHGVMLEYTPSREPRKSVHEDTKAVTLKIPFPLYEKIKEDSIRRTRGHGYRVSINSVILKILGEYFRCPGVIRDYV